MADHSALVRRLFEAPGQPPHHTETVIDGAAECHRRLIQDAASRCLGGLGDAVAALLENFADDERSAYRRRILNHPQLVDALHALASVSPVLRDWDEATFPPGPGSPAPGDVHHGIAKLNGVAWPSLLRRCPSWSGRIDLCTDALGFLRFAQNDWSLWLRATRESGHDEVLGDAVVTVAMEPDRVIWSLAGEPQPEAPFLVMTRRDLLRLVAAGEPGLSIDNWAFPNPAIRPRLLSATPLDDAGLRYEPAGFDDKAFAAHAGMTGAIIQAMLEAIQTNAPAIRDEIRRYLVAIRGHALPTASGQTLTSFSTPNLPGVANVNIPYGPDGQPRFCPFGFTCLGHELGHTKHYLIDDAAYGAGLRFVRNPGDRSNTIPRYGRPLAVRTLFQVPYVHLYEWALLTAFRERAFAGLPWDVAEDPVAFGNDLAAEIREAFDLIAQYADLTDLGVAAVRHLRSLYDQALDHWTARTS